MRQISERVDEITADWENLPGIFQGPAHLLAAWTLQLHDRSD
jgi:hypothetical protein